ncbi:MAG TPA: aminoacyl-tRNA hydrolase [Feifaniaceae bacterium]|nr:aminoacyl-tRNA hydrolase [Feifaniaceae bacterium]
MYLIAGLGNPGIAYRNSRHNAGFLALDTLSQKLGIPFSKRAHRALIGEGYCGAEKLLLCKPETYMNLSGEAVQSVLSYYKLPPERLIVLYDDIDLPVGDIRIRASGSAGTHNGMRSIIACLGGEEGFPRVRIGIGRQKDGRDLAAFVLGKPPREERELLEDSYKNAAEAALLIVEGKLGEAQAMFNKRKKPKEGMDHEE